jgi:hypothetical protein
MKKNRKTVSKSSEETSNEYLRTFARIKDSVGNNAEMIKTLENQQILIIDFDQ